MVVEDDGGGGGDYDDADARSIPKARAVSTSAPFSSSIPFRAVTTLCLTMVAASTPIANRPDCLDILEAYDAKVTGEVKGEVSLDRCGTLASRHDEAHF